MSAEGSIGDVKSVVVIGEKKIVNRLLLTHAFIQGDYSSESEMPIMYQPTRSYPFTISSTKTNEQFKSKKTNQVISVKIFPVLEDLDMIRKAVLETLSADIFLLVYWSSSIDELDTIRDKYIYEIRDYEDKHFSLNTDVLDLYNEDEERPRIPLVLCGVQKKNFRQSKDKNVEDLTITDCAEDINSDLSLFVDLSDEKSVISCFEKITILCNEFTPIIQEIRRKLDEKKKEAEKILREKVTEKIKTKKNKFLQKATNMELLNTLNTEGGNLPIKGRTKRKNTILSRTKKFFRPARKIFNSSRDSSKVQIDEALQQIENFQDTSIFDSDSDNENENNRNHLSSSPNSEGGTGLDGDVDTPGGGGGGGGGGKDEINFEISIVPIQDYSETPNFLTILFRCLKRYDYKKGVLDFDQDTEKVVEDILKLSSKNKNISNLENRKAINLKNNYSEKILFYLLKSVIESFPQPLCSYFLYDDFLKTNEIHNRSKKIFTMQNILSQLSNQDKEILGILLLMFKHIEKTLPSQNKNNKNNKTNLSANYNIEKLIVLNDLSLFLTPLILYSRPPSMVRFLEEKKCVFFMIKEAENIVLPQFRKSQNTRDLKKEEEEEEEEEENDEENEIYGRLSTLSSNSILGNSNSFNNNNNQFGIRRESNLTYSSERERDSSLYNLDTPIGGQSYINSPYSKSIGDYFIEEGWEEKKRSEKETKKFEKLRKRNMKKYNWNYALEEATNLPKGFTIEEIQNSIVSDSEEEEEEIEEIEEEIKKNQFLLFEKNSLKIDKNNKNNNKKKKSINNIFSKFKNRKEKSKSKENITLKNKNKDNKDNKEEEEEEEEDISDFLENEEKISFRREERIMKKIRELKIDDFWNVLNEKQNILQLRENKKVEENQEKENKKENKNKSNRSSGNISEISDLSELEEEVNNNNNNPLYSPNLEKIIKKFEEKESQDKIFEIEKEKEEKEIIDSDVIMYFYDEETEMYHNPLDYGWYDENDKFHYFEYTDTNIYDNNNKPKIVEEEERKLNKNEFENWDSGICVNINYNSSFEKFEFSLERILRNYEELKENLKILGENQKKLNQKNAVSNFVSLKQRVSEAHKFLKFLKSKEFENFQKTFVGNKNNVIDELKRQSKSSENLLAGFQKTVISGLEFVKLELEYEQIHEELIDQRARFNIFMQMFEDGVAVDIQIQKKIEFQKEKMMTAKKKFDELDVRIKNGIKKIEEGLLKKSNEEKKIEINKFKENLENIKLRNFEKFLM